MSTIYLIPGIRKLQTKLNQLTSYIPPPPTLDRRPRRILLVDTHPVPESFSIALADKVENSAKVAGHEIRRVSLCAHKDPSKCFRPNLSYEERVTYMNPEKHEMTLEVQTYVDLLHWCDTMVLVYPTWWMNTPASLKGFFDRILLMGKTWDLPSKQETATSYGLIPRLTNINKIVGISTYGSSQPIVALAGDNGRRMISTAIRSIMSPDCTLQWLGLYEMDFSTPEQRVQFLTEVDHVVTTL